MKWLQQRQRTWIGWAPTLLLALLFAILSAIEARWPWTFCDAVNPGGKELVCGGEHANFAVQLTTDISIYLFFCVLAFSAFRALQGKLSRVGAAGFAISLCIALAGLALRWQLGSDDSP